MGGPASRTTEPLLGGTLLVVPDAWWFLVVDNAGSTGMPFPIPLSLSFLGFRLNAQAGILDPAAVRGVAFTAALEIWVL